jgi:hypothetical protein
MKLKNIAAAAAIAVSSIGANATTFNIGNLTSLGDDGYTASSAFSASSSFSDIYNFSISGGVNSFGSLATKLSLKATQSLISFSGLLTGTNGFSQSLNSSTEFGGLLQGLAYTDTLASGDYSLQLSGASQSKGTYNVTLMATPVPEPESYAMLLAGLGVMGAIARRRNKADSAA